MKHILIFFAIGISTIIAIIRIYCPHISLNEAGDSNLADSLTSIFYPLAFFLLTRIILTNYEKHSAYSIFKTSVLVCFLMEIINVFYAPYNIDYFDIIALSIGSAFGYYLIYKNTAFRKTLKLD